MRGDECRSWFQSPLRANDDVDRGVVRASSRRISTVISVVIPVSCTVCDGVWTGLGIVCVESAHTFEGCWAFCRCRRNRYLQACSYGVPLSAFPNRPTPAGAAAVDDVKRRIRLGLLATPTASKFGEQRPWL